MYIYLHFLLHFEAVSRVWYIFVVQFITFANTFRLTFQLATDVVTMSINESINTLGA